MAIYNTQADFRWAKFMREYQQFYNHLATESAYLRNAANIYGPSQLKAQHDAFTDRRLYVEDILAAYRTWVQTNESEWEQRLDDFVTSATVIIDHWASRLNTSVPNNSTYAEVLSLAIPTAIRNSMADVIDGELA